MTSQVKKVVDQILEIGEHVLQVLEAKAAIALNSEIFSFNFVHESCINAAFFSKPKVSMN